MHDDVMTEFYRKMELAGRAANPLTTLEGYKELQRELEWAKRDLQHKTGAVIRAIFQSMPDDLKDKCRIAIPRRVLSELATRK